MRLKSKTNFLLKIALCVALALSTFGAVLGFVGEKPLTAQAETVEYQDILAVEDRSWGAASDEYYFGGYTIGASTANNAHWLNTDASVNGCWYHGNDAIIAANNGVDILQYIYVNDTSARDAITANVNSSNQMVGSSGWLTNPAASPVYVETTNGSGLLIKILKAYAGENFTLTFKAGFSLIRNDGNVIYLSDDVVYNCAGNVPTRVNKSTVTFNDENSVVVSTKRVVNGQAIGTLPKVPEKDGYGGFWTIDGAPINETTVISANKTVTPVYGLEYQDYLGIEDRTSWASGGHADIVTFGLMDFSITEGNQYFKSSVADCWYYGNNGVISANNGVDILEYIYLNGVSARSLINANSVDGKTTADTGYWLSNPAAWPIAFETGTDCWIRIDKTAFDGEFTFTIKEGFALVRNDGELICVSNDIVYTYSGGVLSGKTVDKKFTLSFDGADTTKTLRNGDTVGELPSVPERAGYEGCWTIDGVEITADTVYNYGANKTATVVYSKDITETIGLGDWGVPETESDIRYLWIRDNNAEIATAYPNSYWNDHADNKDSNYGVDIMEYILIDGESARSIINANAAGTTSYKASSTFPLNIGGCYAPVCIETAGDGIRFKVMVDYKTSFKVTFKAGFTIVNAEGIRLYTKDDVVYNVGATTGDISKVTGYTLTFEGASSRQVEGGSAIGELPSVPEKAGYEGCWTIDGVEITADTVYNYGANKTATVLYSKNITSTIGLGDWGVPETESDIRYLWIRDNNADIATAYPYEYWNDHEDNKNSNYGVDILEYILIDGESVRSIINANAAGTTSYKASSTFPLNVGGCYAPISLSTLGDGARFKVMVDYKTAFELTFKAGFTIVTSEGVKLYTTEDVVYNVAEGSIAKVMECTLSFEGLDDKITVVNGQSIGELPVVPEQEGLEGYWTIDGVEIDENTVYNYGADKTAVAAYRKDISKYIALEDRTSWAVCETGGEYAFGVLDMSTVSKDANGNDVNYLNSNNAGCWYHGNNAPIEANNGIDIMQYIYINETSARDLITANVNGDKLANDCNGDGLYGETGDCWLGNVAASPVYVETTTNAGIMIKVLQSFVGNYFEITLKSGFSLVNTDGVRVYLTKDVTYKYIVTDSGTTFAKGALTDDDLDMLNGQEITLKNGEEEILVKKTCRLTLPKLDDVINQEEGLTQIFVGWTTDPAGLTTLYPAGYKFQPDSATELSAVWLGFEMEDGAAVRLASGSSGIRFTVHVDKGGYDAGVTLGLITDIGTIICPATYLVNGRELTHGLGAGYYKAVSVGLSSDKFVEESTGFKYSTAFVGIAEKDFSRKYAARGYLQIQFTTGVGYVYTNYNEEVNARSIYEVAEAAYNDTEVDYTQNATILNYLNKVLDISWDDNYNFSANSSAVGNSVVTGISREGYTITVNYTGDIASVLINGERLAQSGNANVAIGDLLYSFSNLEFVDGAVKFTLGAASKSTDKKSDESLYFVSSDTDLDFFLNDFFKRHTGVYEDGENLKVNSTIAGVDAEEFFNQEWVSMSYYWFNSFEGYEDEKGNTQNRLAGMNARLENVPVDDYGYVWSSNDRVRDPKSEIETGEQKMGWPFPNNDTVSTSHWEFNSGNESWSSNISASASDGLYGQTLNNQSSNITFTSKSFSSITSKKIYTFYAPLLEFEVRIADATNIEDIYVWYTTSSSTSFSEDKRVSVKENAFLNYDLGSATGEYNHILYLPMYAQTAWGESTSTYVKQLKIEIVLKSGTTLSGYVGLNYVRPTLDTRMSNNNSIYISSLRTAYDYTGDIEFLSSQMTRARKAYNFLMQMYDSTRMLKKESYLVGHGGAKESLSWLGNATNKSIASSISQGYWDIMYMPEYDFQSNVYFQKALVDMAYLEQVLSDNSITVNKADAKVKTATRGGGYSTCLYTKHANSITKMNTTASNNLTAIQANLDNGGFWNPDTGRFAAGYDPNGTLYDYGYVAWNLEAIYYGIATDDQAASIMNWLANEGNLYKYEFAPLSITVTGDADALNGEYAAQGDKWVNCQFGGAIFYTSFYDIMARLEVNGTDDAFARLQAIQEWYKKIYDYYQANGSDPYEFYRYYYDNEGIQCQGMGTAGPVGIDREFLESTLPMASVAYGFFGIDSVDGKTLEIAPELPADKLTFWKMENLAFNYVKYDLKITENTVVITDVRGDTTGLSLQIALDITGSQSVYVNGVKVDSPTVVDGKVIVTVAFGATIVEVK
ncbi:MAG: hypothetical protein IKA61_04215 [Clostridia bacterium]|nr:hypothetical protein [Clostridia bacterium]